jgi:hypothetical protein
MTINEIVQKILCESPNEKFHVDVLANKIYEIKTIADLRRVKMSLVSILRAGNKEGLWEFLTKNTYRYKKGSQTQGKFGNS